MLTFYWQLLQRTPRLCRDGLLSVFGWIQVILFLLLLLNEKIAESAAEWWEGVSPAWSLIPVAVFIVHCWLRGAYRMIEDQKRRAEGERQRAEAAEGVLQKLHDNRKQQDMLGKLLTEGQKLYGERLASDSEVDDWVRRLSEWIQGCFDTIASSDSRAKATAFIQINPMAADISDSFNRRHNDARLKVQALCENLKQMLG